MVAIVMAALSWLGATIGLVAKICNYCKGKNDNADK